MMRQPNAPVRASAGSLLTRVPGRATPRAQVLKEFEEGVAEPRRRYVRALWPLLIPNAGDLYRWRMQLECGCVREVLTRGRDSFPDHGSDVDPLTSRRLLDGEYWCNEHVTAKPYRDIVDWVDSETKEFPPDPVEPQHGLDPKTWAMVRFTEAHSSAFWLVTLDWGHYMKHVVTDVDWKPEDGPRVVSAERRDEMRIDFADLWEAESKERPWPKEERQRDHMRKMIDLRWPQPEPEQECYACAYTSRVIGYQRIGWLVARSKPPVSEPNRREAIQAQLAKAEAEVQRLQLKLDDET